MAFVLAVGQSVTTLLPAAEIWGTSMDENPQRSIQPGLKAHYAGEMLFVSAICLAKLAIPVGLWLVSPVKEHRIANIATGVITAMWALTSILGLAFQCRLPYPWGSHNWRCVDRISLFRYVGVVNILTDVALIILPTVIVAPLHMPLRKRISILLLFNARICAIAATIAQLIYIPRLFSHNYTLEGFPFIVCTQIAQAASFVSACVPYMQPFMESLQSGLLWTDEVQQKTSASNTTSNITSKTSRSNNSYVEIDTQRALTPRAIELQPF
ncbi:hypothetical protein EV356DRAFT_508079 [Viridothelium virens]|uniref:Rhodopsin domain-containing protein n=1 Tax=Viridothelium virens TaxID=1048519 RepID=A0A6A6GZ68_VIRVR|nr:hypothetical protein EV356DRAFT_508079 [Viridothelium virens]